MAREDNVMHGMPLRHGVDAERYAHNMSRWRDSGYDTRLVPYSWPDDATQRYYDLYDAWANTGYQEESPYWPPRTRRGRLLPGVDSHGDEPIPKRGWDGYEPDKYRLSVWGMGGLLDEELAERGTLGLDGQPDIGQPGEPMEGHF